MEVVSNKASQYVTAEELNTIQNMNSDFTRAKIALGEIELQRHGLLKHIDELKEMFAKNERMLIEKYGENAVINVKTGEVTDKVHNNNT